MDCTLGALLRGGVGLEETPPPPPSHTHTHTHTRTRVAKCLKARLRANCSRAHTDALDRMNAIDQALWRHVQLHAALYP